MFKKMRDRFYLFLILFSCLNFFPFSSFFYADVRAEEVNNRSHPAVIAIIDITGTRGKLSDAISLMTAKLSQKSDIHLVERGEIDTVLKELELSVSGLTSRGNALKLGRMLKADGLVFLSLSDDGKILRVRLVDTRYGLRLLDTLVEWKEGEISRIVEEIILWITSVAPKLLISPEKEVLIGILGMRSVEPNSYLNWLELSLPGLISSRLSQEPRIIVLEREDLDLVLKEDLLTKGEGSKFLGSMALLEGEIEQISGEDKEHRFTLTLHIKEADGKSAGDFKSEGDTEKLPPLTENIAKWVVKSVTDLPPQGNWDVKNEAERFLREGQMSMANISRRSARAIIETAYALDPGNESIARTLLTAYLYEENDSSFERAQFVYRQIYLLAGESQRGAMEPKRILLWLAEQPWTYLNSKDSVATEEIKLFNRRSRRDCGALSERAFASSLQIEKFEFYFTGPEWPTPVEPIRWYGAVSETPEEVIGHVKKGISKLLLGREKGGYPISDYCRLYFLVNYLTGRNYACYVYSLRADHLDYKELLISWLGLLEEPSKSDDPIVKISAELGLSSIFYNLSLNEKDKYSQFNEHSEKVMKILIDELDYPNELSWVGGRLILRWLIFSETMQIRYPSYPYPEIWLQKVERLLKPLIDKNDIENLLLWTPSAIFAGVEDVKTDSVTAKRILDLLDSVIRTLDNTDKYLDDHVVYAVHDIIREPTVGGCEQLSSLISTRKRFLKSHPEIKTEGVSLPVVKVSLLCDINKIVKQKDEFHIAISETTREGKILWVSLIGEGKGWIQDEIWLIGIDLKDKSLRSFWRAYLPSLSTSRSHKLITAPVIDTDAIFVGVWGFGIIKFPGRAQQGIEYLENPEVIKEEDGLPSNRICSIARVGNRLYVSLGADYLYAYSSSIEKESGLGVYDLKKKEWNTISSSRSKDISCPLNIEQPYKITSLTPTQDGKKLFFLCEQWEPQEAHTRVEHKELQTLEGLWKMDIESGKIEHIWKAFYGPFSSYNIVPGERKWWIRTNDLLMSFDPDSETGEVIVYNVFWTGAECHKDWLGAEVKASAASREPPSLEKVRYVTRKMVQFNAKKSALYKDVFWALIGTGRYNISVLEDMPCCIFVDKDVLKVKRVDATALGNEQITGFFPTPYGVVVIGKNKIGLIEENPEH